MVSTVRWNIFGVWSISEVDSIDVVRDFTINYVDQFVRLLLCNWSEVALQNWVHFRVNFELTVKNKLNWLEEKPK